jgi:hypothetical protein
LRCGFILRNHHGCFVIYFPCIVKLVRKVIFIMLFRLSENIYLPKQQASRGKRTVELIVK